MSVQQESPIEPGHSADEFETPGASEKRVTRVVKFCVNTQAMTQDQLDLFERHAGTARAVWNWGLACYNEHETKVRRLVREAAGREAIARHGADDREHVQAVYKDDAWRKAAFKVAGDHVARTLPLTGAPITANGLDKEFTQLAKTGVAYGTTRDGDPKTFTWWVDEDHGVSRYAVSQSLRMLERAVKDYRSGKSKRSPRKRKDSMPSGWPTFKSKRDAGSFAIMGISIGASGKSRILTAPKGSAQAGHRLMIPNIGTVPVHNDLRRLRRYIAKGGVPKSARFTQVADRWYVSINVSFAADNPYVTPKGPSRRQRRNGAVGVDRGVVLLAALSNGETFGGLLPAKVSQARRAKIQRKASRAVRGSARHKRLIRAAARIDHLSALQRATAIHHVTKHLTTTYETVVVEDLKVRSMVRSVAPKPDPETPGHFLPNGKSRKTGLNRSMHDAALSEMHRQLTYKSERYGSSVVSVPAAYTSEDCSVCGHREKQHRSDTSRNRKSQAVFECVACGFTCNADVNAAVNILNRHLGLPGAGDEASASSRTRIPTMRGTHEMRGSGPAQAGSASASLTSEVTRHNGQGDLPALLDSA